MTSHSGNAPKVYCVVAPYSYIEPVLDDGSGPTEEAAHVLYVRTSSKKKAMWMAVRAWRRRIAYTRASRPLPRQAQIYWRHIPDALNGDRCPASDIQVQRVDRCGCRCGFCRCALLIDHDGPCKCHELFLFLDDDVVLTKRETPHDS